MHRLINHEKIFHGPKATPTLTVSYYNCAKATYNPGRGRPGPSCCLDAEPQSLETILGMVLCAQPSVRSNCHSLSPQPLCGSGDGPLWSGRGRPG